MSGLRRGHRRPRSVAGLARLWRARAQRVDPSLRALIWAVVAGMLFCCLNVLARAMAQQLESFQAQFMRYLCGILVMLPLVLRHGPAQFMPRRIGGQFTRGAVHAAGLCLWFYALPRIPLANMTAIGFTTPIFIMLGAALVLRERLHGDRWAAALLGFTGVLIVVMPNLSGAGGLNHLVMLASAPMFAVSLLITKAQTGYERPEVIVLWQAITVTIYSMPMAWWVWQPATTLQWGSFVLMGVIGNLAHYCLYRGYRVADISATQSVKFLDLVWSAALGWLVFGDLPSQYTMLGGAVIFAATAWIARREAVRRRN